MGTKDHRWTEEEVTTLQWMLGQHCPIKDIAESLGMDVKMVHNKISSLKRAEKSKRTDKPEETITAPALASFQPREMIKRLYDLGYRIKDNDLYCIVKVNLRDIINNG